MIDLHTHSSASDGEYSPSQVVFFAAERGLSLIALTDHDTVQGLEEGAAAAAEKKIDFVKGIEININRAKGEFHLLGLGLDNISSSLLELAERLQNDRIARNRRILERMKDDGYPVDYGEMISLYPGQSIGRPHIAGYLLEKKIVRRRQQAFDRFIGHGRPYYISKQGAELDQAIQAISESGGVPVIAHPLSLYISWGKMEAALSELHSSGVLGLEAWHPGAKVAACRRLEEMARKIGFFITAGSDFHGESIRADRKLGHTAGKIEIADSFWTEELQPALQMKRDGINR
ncbi:MAG: PHP domain-containing protein [Treponemataceae bacterium]|nr:PHP domain-containing protein [Treponemataceae bacterium]